jgi:hypothetical protein
LNVLFVHVYPYFLRIGVLYIEIAIASTLVMFDRERPAGSVMRAMPAGLVVKRRQAWSSEPPRQT